MTEHLHIVCLDAPSPPGYGGAIDMYFMIKSLAAEGKKIHLHYFDYKRGRNTSGLENDCVSITSYKRKSFFSSLFTSTPHIVHSRINQQLIRRLNEDSFPVILSSIHCAGIIPYIKDQSRLSLRCHNIESVYYQQLGTWEKNLFKKIYYQNEGRRLAAFEKTIDKNIPLFCLSESDAAYFRNQLGFHQVSFAPCFIAWQSLNCKQGSGTYALYHGNLEVAENEAAALWLIEQVFASDPFPLVVAGKSPSRLLKEKIKKYPHTRLISDPTEDELNGLIANAHMHLLPSFSKTGVKLKLLHALMEGRFCITNDNGIAGTGIKTGVLINNTATDMVQTIRHLAQIPFGEEERNERNAILSLYNNRKNARLFIDNRGVVDHPA